MKFRICESVLAVAGALAVSAGAVSPASAALDPLVTVNEKGVGSIDFCAPGCKAKMPGFLAADPGPDGSGALSYDLLGPPSVTDGDLLIFRKGVLDDIVRFNDNGTGGAGYPASLVFYSIDAGSNLADTLSPPTSFYGNVVSVNEVKGQVFYNPRAGQPGYVSTFNAAYSITSAPEPAAWAMMLIGVAGLGAVARRRRAFSG